jgi:phage shock protein PspC (stress-responsive transcriptional regulator)
MKKTTSIHIKGINFIIEEDAYETLKNYMARLERKLSNTKGKEEIIEDIELRVAELFTTELGGTKEVIEQKDVDKTIAILGEPEQYIDEDGTEEFESNGNDRNEGFQENRGEYSRSEKKLYRDMEKASIAGVCSGLSAYFNIDLIIVRIIFVLLLFGGGFGFPLYIVLWIVLPTANSHIDRLRMRGRPITVDSVREEVEMAAQRLTKSSREFEQHLKTDTVFTKGANTIGRLISKVIGLFLLVFGFCFSIVFVFGFVLRKGIVPVTNENGMLTPYEFGNLVFEPYQMSIIWWVGGAMLLIFIVYIVATAMRFILNIRYPWYKYLTRFTIVAMITTVVFGFYVGTTVAREFSFDSEIKTEIASTETPFEITYTSLHTIANTNKNIRSRHNSEMTIRKGYIFQEGYRIRLRESADSSYHVYYIKTSNGRSNGRSLDRAKNIRFSGTLVGKILESPNYYSYPITDKIRAQRIRIVVEIPPGKTIKFRDEYYDAGEDSHELWVPSMNWDDPEWDD